MGLAGNADAASPWISPMWRMVRGFFIISFCNACVCFGRAIALRAFARGGSAEQRLRLLARIRAASPQGVRLRVKG